MEWNGHGSGVLECHAHHVSSMVTSHDCSNTAVTHSSIRTVIANSELCYLVILVTASACRMMGCSIFGKSL